MIKASTVSHVFKNVGNYTATVTVLGHESHAPANLGIVVDERKHPWGWLYILAGLAVVTLACLMYAKWKPKAAVAGPVTFYPHSDWNAPQNPPKNLAINYDLVFHPNVSAGQDRLETDGASSIVRKKKQ